MTDVRLTALNPDDSQVYPVACNAAGAIRIEEIPDQTFKGDLDGNLTVTGNADIDGDITVGDPNTQDESAVGSSISSGLIAAKRDSEAGSDRNVWIGYKGKEWTSYIRASGDAQFKGNVTLDGGHTTSNGVTISKSGWIKVRADDLPEGSIGLAVYRNGNSANDIAGMLNFDGSATFAGGTAGFTKEGYLWCTDSRNSTWMLDFISNGMPQWKEYTHPSRKDLVEEKLDEWSEKDKPAES